MASSGAENFVFTADGDPVVFSSALLGGAGVSPPAEDRSPGEGNAVTDCAPQQEKDSFDELLAERRRKIIDNLAKGKKEQEASQDKDADTLSDKASSTSTITPAKFRASVSRVAATAIDRFDVFTGTQLSGLRRSASVTSQRIRNRGSAHVANLNSKLLRLSRGLQVDRYSSSPDTATDRLGSPFEFSSSEKDDEEDMSSPLAHKSRKKNVCERQEPRQLSLRQSTFAPSNLADIPSMSTATELAESTGNMADVQEKPLVQDFGHFKVGTAQYSHAHWHKGQIAKVTSSNIAQSADQLQVDPNTLKPDAESLRGEICDNDSSTSLSGSISNAGVSDIKVSRTRPYQMSPDPSLPAEVSYLEDASPSVPSVGDNTGERSSSSTTVIHSPEDADSKHLVPSSDENSNIDSGDTLPVIPDHAPPATPGYPLIQPDPFSLPMLSTTWNAKDAREWKKDLKTKCEDKRRPKNDHILNIVNKPNAADQVISIHEAAFEGPDELPPPPKTPSRKSLTGSWGRARTATLRATPGTESSKRTASSALRSVSDKLRGKTPPEPERFSSDKFLKDRETYLRTVTSTLPNPNSSMFPNHPNTNKPWMHRNLRCTDCSDKCCSKCGRACCAYKAAVDGTKTHTRGTNYYRAAGHAEEIAKFRVYGRELPTFLKCTDCEKMFCPDCCGECADPQCRLVCCRGCKSDPWVNCDWHENH